MLADESLKSRVRQILLDHWDPHDVVRNPAASGSYDGYITPLLDLIRSGGGEDEIVQFLKDREAESMCFPALGTSRLRIAARKLASLRSETEQTPH